MSSFNTIFFSLLGGVLPALLWLWFWLKEDKLQPEPRSRIMLTFICGMIAVWPAIEMERHLCYLVGPLVCSSKDMMPSPLLIILWAMTEEIFKYIFAFFSSFWKNKYNDEPIDAVIYMITAALGFSAFENALFLSNLISVGSFAQSIITGNSRFLGATLLHVISSATIGAMIGLSFYKKPLLKKVFLALGLCMAIILHVIFNLLIINRKDDLFLIFAGVWVLIILLIVLIEKIKKVNS